MSESLVIHCAKPLTQRRATAVAYRKQLRYFDFGVKAIILKPVY